MESITVEAAPLPQEKEDETDTFIIFKSQYEEKKVTDGTVKYDTANFTGKRNDTQKNDAVSEHLVSTGFQSGTLFWTTKK